MRPIREIIIHCSATPPNQDIGVAEIRQWHIDKGWRDVGYHYCIRRNGEVEQGRPVKEEGAHVAGHNAYSIGVCLIGGLNRSMKPDCNFTRLQWSALNALVFELTEEYREAQVTGHRAYSTKACPTFDAVTWWYG